MRRDHSMAIFDLTRPLSTGMPVYPDDPDVRLEPHAEYTLHGFRVSRVELGTHAGTHVDAPAHFLRDGVTVEQLPMASLLGPARVIELFGASRDGGPFSPGDRVLVRSGWGEHWGQPDYFAGFPGLPEMLVDELAAAPVALLGLETPSLHPDPAEDARQHRILLGAGIVIVENLAGLDHLPERVMLAALPLPLEGADGAPCRVMAWELPLSTQRH